jgi:glycosyltransferase involved in cell wall biosynthesis
VTTVSPPIVRDYAERTGVPTSLVTNAPYFRELAPSDVSEPIRLVHVGVADERRRLEDTIDAVRRLGGRVTLDLALARDNEYRGRLERMAAPYDFIRVLPPVPQEELISMANGYDVGVHLMPVNLLNHLYSLPNKLFDYIQARLAVAIGPSPAMAEVVHEWDCGIVSASHSPEDFAEALSRLTVAEVTRLKQNADRAAHVLNAESNRKTVLSAVGEAIGSSPRAVSAAPGGP